MLNQRELAEGPNKVDSLLRELEAVKRQLSAERARNDEWRTAIERHLQKGCPSRSLLALLEDEDSLSTGRSKAKH
jgi:hypothetical protein